jgi:hypothetical protein
MVYYLILLSCACIGIAGASRTMRKSASAEDRQDHPWGKLGSEDGRRRSGRTSGACDPEKGISGRTSGVTPDIRRLSIARTSGLPPGNPASTLQRRLEWPVPGRTFGPCPGHPASRERPDIRPPAGHPAPACAHEQGPRPMYPPLSLTPSWTCLYILHLHLLSRVSKCDSSFRDRALLIHPDLLHRERPRPLRRRSILDSRPLTGRSI